ncbi:hypothetical protein HJFPF1_12827 [Paramyrothecium foliicola]|nr:hypothetical protein HJFPF1_12827 [Paramyrothecium foliicola]
MFRDHSTYIAPDLDELGLLLVLYQGRCSRKKLVGMNPGWGRTALDRHQLPAGTVAEARLHWAASCQDEDLDVPIEYSKPQRFIPFLGYHHVLMILIAVSIILLSLLLAGCSSSSPLIPDIFLLSLYYQGYEAVPDTAQVDYNVHTAIANIAGDAHLQARVGYFGICVNPDGGSWLCSNNATALANEVSVDQDPLNLIWLAAQFKDMIVFPYLIIIAIVFAFICFLLLATFPGWHDEEDSEGSDREVKPFPSRPVSQVALAIIFIASIFVLVSVLWQHTASVAASIIAQDFGNGSVRSGVGSSAMVLGWFSFTLLIIVTIGLLVMILSIKVLSQLV